MRRLGVLKVPLEGTLVHAVPSVANERFHVSRVCPQMQFVQQPCNSVRAEGVNRGPWRLTCMTPDLPECRKAQVSGLARSNF